MSLAILTDRAAIDRAQGKLRKSITQWSDPPEERLVGFPGGRRPVRIHWCRNLRFWAGFVPEVNRHWNSFGVADPTLPSGVLSITVEINPPFEGLNRHIQGAYAVDSNRDVYLVHRGKLGGKSTVRQADFLSYFQHRGAVENVLDGDRTSTVVLVAKLGDAKTAAHVASFVDHVDRLKKAGSRAAIDATTMGTLKPFSPEFQGEKRLPARDVAIAKCNHGAIVNELERLLKASGFTTAYDQHRDLYAVQPRRRVGLLFEVKPTSGLYSTYEAIGQLMFHAREPRIRRVAVLPSGVRPKIQQRLKELGIEVLTFHWRGAVPVFPGVEDMIANSKQRKNGR